MFTRQNFGQWTEAGATDATERAHTTSQRWLDEYTTPAMPADTLAALDEFVARRTADGGAHPES